MRFWSKQIIGTVLFSSYFIVFSCTIRASDPIENSNRLNESKTVSTGNKEGASILKIGLPKSLFRGIPSRALQLANKPFLSLIESQTGLKGEVINTDDVDSTAKLIQDKKIQLGVFQGFEYARIQKIYPKLRPLVIAAPTVDNSQVLVITRSDPCRKLSDISGKKIGICKNAKDHVFLYWNKLLISELSSEKCKYQEVTDAKELLHDVFEKNFDVAVIDSANWKTFKENNPGRAEQLHILAKSIEFPQPVIVYNDDGLGQEDLEKCRKGLIKAHQSAKARVMLQMIKVKGFNAIPENYDDLLKLTLENYPSEEIQRISLEKESPK